MVSKDEVKDKIIKIIAKVFNKDESEINMDLSFDDLGVRYGLTESDEFNKTIMECESEFEVGRVPLESIEGFGKVGDLLEWFFQKHSK